MAMKHILSWSFVMLHLLVQVYTTRLVLPKFISYPLAEVYVDREQTKQVKIEIEIAGSNSSVDLVQRSADELKTLPASVGAKITQLATEPGFSDSRSVSRYEVEFSHVADILDVPLHWVIRNSLGALTGDEFRVLKIEIDPFPLVSNENFDFLLGNVGVVSCVLPHSRPSPPPMIFFHNETSLDTNSGRYKVIYIGKGLGGRVVLLIHNLQFSDAGEYKCQAKLGKRTIKAEKLTRLFVNTATQKKPNKFRFSSHSSAGSTAKILAIEGDNVTLYCIFESSPVKTVNWFFKTDKPTVKDSHIKIDARIGTIEFTNIKLEDAKSYTCFPEDNDNSVSKTFNITVIKRTKIKTQPKDAKLAKLGDEAMLKCELDYQSGTQSNRANWFLNAKLINPKNNAHFQITESHLLIRNVTKPLLGIYQCWTVDNHHNWISSMATLTLRSVSISEDVKSHEQIPPAVKLDAKINHHFICKLDRFHDKSFHVKWYRGPQDRLILATDREYFSQFANQALLTLMNTAQSDSGLYTCRIFENKTNIILGEERFNILVTDGLNGAIRVPSSDENGFGEVEKKNDQINVITAPPREQIKSIDGPIAKQMKPYLLEISLNWTHVKEFQKINHYRVEILESKSGSRRSSVRRTARSVPESQFDMPRVLPHSVTGQFLIINEDMGLKPNRIYRFRILGIPIESTASTVETAWSQSLSLEHMLSEYLVINELKSASASSLFVSWSWVQSAISSKVIDRYHLLYREVTSSNREERDRWMKENVESLIVLGSSVTYTKILKLQLGREYEVAIYGVGGDESRDNVFYTKLSEGMTMKLEENVAKLDPLVNEGQNNPPEVKKTEGGGDAGSLNTNNDGFMSQEQHRIWFLVLGSLSGVFLVVVLVLVSIFIWDKLKRHRKRREGRSPIYASPAIDSHHFTRNPALLAAAAQNQTNPGQWTGTLKRRGQLGDPEGALTVATMGAGNGLPAHHRHLLLQQKVLQGSMPNGVPARNFLTDTSCYNPYMMDLQADQASSVYSQVGSDSRFSSNALHVMGGNNLGCDNYSKQPDPVTNESFNFRTLPSGFTLASGQERDGVTYQPPFDRPLGADMMESYISHSQEPQHEMAQIYPYAATNYSRLPAHSNVQQPQFYQTFYPHHPADQLETKLFTNTADQESQYSGSSQNDGAGPDSGVDVSGLKSTHNGRPANLPLSKNLASIDGKTDSPAAAKKSGKKSAKRAAGAAVEKKSSQSQLRGLKDLCDEEKEELIPLFGGHTGPASSIRRPTGDIDSGVKSDDDHSGPTSSFEGDSSFRPHNNNNKPNTTSSQQISEQAVR